KCELRQQCEAGRRFASRRRAEVTVVLESAREPDEEFAGEVALEVDVEGVVVLCHVLFVRRSKSGEPLSARRRSNGGTARVRSIEDRLLAVHPRRLVTGRDRELVEPELCADGRAQRAVASEAQVLEEVQVRRPLPEPDATR